MSAESAEPGTGWPAEIVLCRQHREQLQASAITAEVAAARGYRTLHRTASSWAHDARTWAAARGVEIPPGERVPATVLADYHAARDEYEASHTRDDQASAELARAGIPSWAYAGASSWPVLVIPMRSPAGAFDGISVRPCTAPKGRDGKSRKYAYPKGRSVSLDVHPINRDRVADPTVPLFVTEGIKKADALTSAGYCAIAVNGIYGWRRTSGAEAVWESVPIKGRQVVLVFDSDTNERGDLQRAVKRLGAFLKHKGAKVYYLVIPSLDGTLKTGIDDWVAAGHSVADLEQVASLTPPMVDEEGRFTDAKLSDYFAEILADDFLYAVGIGWLQWDGRRWRECGDGPPLHALKVAVIAEFDAMCDDTKGHPEKLIMLELFKKVMSHGRISGILKFVRAHERLAIRADEFDAHPHLLNVGNGVVDLRTGDLLAHDPDLRLTKLTTVDYVQGLEHRDWEAALQAVPPEDLEFLQDRFGQALTGSMTPDDRVVFASAKGSNGKSTVFGAVLKAVGEHGRLVPDKLLTARPNEHSTELTDLKGVRLALLEELPDGQHVNTDRLKKLAGTAQITARRIAENNITWQATHSLFVTTNHELDIKDVDYGTWRRFAFTRWPYKYVECPSEPHHLPIDPTLRERLLSGQEALRAVLAWCVEGAVTYYRRGHMLPLPMSLQVELDGKRDDVDTLGAFLRDTLTLGGRGCVWTDELGAQFIRWNRERGYSTLSLTTFRARLKGHPWFSEARLGIERVRASTAELSNPGQRELSAQPPDRVLVLRGARFRAESFADQQKCQ